MLLVTLLIAFIPLSALAGQFKLSDYFSSTSLADTTEGVYRVHDVHVDVDVPKFQWVLLGQERGCRLRVDGGSWMKAIMSLQGATSRFRPLAKKQYQFKFKSQDGKSHHLVFRHSYLDPAYTREKMSHDIVYNAGGIAIKTSHVNLHINGEYNGLYQVGETIDRSMLNNRLDAEVGLWYYIKRTYHINALSDGSTKTTSKNKLLALKPEDLTEAMAQLFGPLLAVSNSSLPMSTVLDVESQVAFLVSKHLMQIGDVMQHNFYLAVDPESTKLHTVLWDADRSLGVSTYRGKSIVDGTLVSPHFILGRAMAPSDEDIIQAPGKWYDGLTEGTMYHQKYLSLTSTDGPLSQESLADAMQEIRIALADSAKKDERKWSRWYCSRRMSFDTAIGEMTNVLLKRAHNSRDLILTGGENMQDGMYSDFYFCDEQWTGKGNVGMFALLLTVFLLNIAALLDPSAALVQLYAWQRNKGEACASLSPKAILRTYSTRCLERFADIDNWINILVAAALLVSYFIYAQVDILDDSEILGADYMADLKYIWIYFSVAINVAFLVRSDVFRVLAWCCLVLASNIYSIIDLIAFVGTESDETSVNSRGISISIDNVENRIVFILFVVWRVSSQLIMVVYSLRIPAISKRITAEIDKAQESRDSDKEVTDHWDIEAHSDGSPHSIELVCLEADDLTNSDKVKDLITTPATEELNLNSVLDVTEPDEPEMTPEPPPAPPSKLQLAGDELVEYKKRMKLFMRLNMAVFICICVGYVIYLSVQGTLVATAAQVFLSTLISLTIMINIRAFYSCAKWFWFHAYGFDTATIDLMFGNREDGSTWSLEAITSMKIQTRRSMFSFLLPGQHLSTEKKIRTVDGWTKKVAHTYDGMLVFILSAESFSSGESSSETYSLAYAISLIYMLLYVASYSSNGTLAWIIYGAKARVMDGFLGRENEIFGFMFDKYMLPASVPLLLWLKLISGDDEIIYLSWYIFMPIIVGDSFAEVVGATWGKQHISVCGMGEVNKKSWEGTLAMFLSSFVILVAVTAYANLPWHWYLFAFVNCFVATFIELYAYRSTDNVCMMLFSCLLCIAYVQAKAN